MLRREGAEGNQHRQKASLLWEQRRSVGVNLFPSAALLNQRRCSLTSDLSDSAIRIGDCPHHVACNDGDVSVNVRLAQCSHVALQKGSPVRGVH